MNIYANVDEKDIEKLMFLFNRVYDELDNSDKLNFYLLTDPIPEILPYTPLSIHGSYKKYDFEKEYKKEINNNTKNKNKNNKNKMSRNNKVDNLKSTDTIQPKKNNIPVIKKEVKPKKISPILATLVRT